jgi:hypothetical protein
LRNSALASLIEDGSSGSLLDFESTAEEIKEFHTTNKGTDLDDIVDILDLYFTSTDNDTDTATTSVSDEQQVEVFHSVSTTNEFILAFDAIPQNIKVNSTIQPLEGEYQGNIQISVTPVLLLKHYLPILLKFSMFFKFQIILLTFLLRVPSDLLSKLLIMTLNYLELLNFQQCALFYAACPPTFIYNRLYKSKSMSQIESSFTCLNLGGSNVVGEFYFAS